MRALLVVALMVAGCADSGSAPNEPALVPTSTAPPELNETTNQTVDKFPSLVISNETRIDFSTPADRVHVVDVEVQGPHEVVLIQPANGGSPAGGVHYGFLLLTATGCQAQGVHYTYPSTQQNIPLSSGRLYAWNDFNEALYLHVDSQNENAVAPQTRTTTFNATTYNSLDAEQGAAGFEHAMAGLSLVELAYQRPLGAIEAAWDHALHIGECILSEDAGSSNLLGNGPAQVAVLTTEPGLLAASFDGDYDWRVTITAIAEA